MRSAAAWYNNDDLVRGVATTHAQTILACHPGYMYRLYTGMQVSVLFTQPRPEAV